MGPDLRFAHELADAADAITLGRFRASDLGVETKADASPVTEADKAAENELRSLVAGRRAGEGVFGEEGGDDGGDVRWIVDPIDGTRNYVRGIPVWATLLALEREGVVDVALVSAPALARRWWAARGEGAWAGGGLDDGDRCRVSSVAQIADAVVSTTSSRHMPDGWIELAARSSAVRGLSDFWQHCLVAEGAVDVATDTDLQLWDYAAVELIVAEAGGRCTTFSGGAPSPAASFVSTNGLLHDEAVALLSRGQTPQQL
jgi:histidinol-phosphatase